jgi:hypothetical protein
MNRSFTFVSGLFVAVILALAPSAGSAQLAGSITGGVAGPTGDAGDLFDPGFTVQGRAELSLLFAGVHANGGFTRLSGKEITAAGVTVESDAVDFFNVGVGARVGLGALLWAGANANYYIGSDVDNELGIVPEVGASLGPIEAIADFKITGDVNWWSIRAGIRF